MARSSTRSSRRGLPEVGTGATRAEAYLPTALLARLARPIDALSETVECTMVFADVSGFTRLSERLARRGREGAEQLVDVINACFSALLAEADAQGGSLVKFGGDAMLLLFHDQEGDQQHPVRACCAAAAMRRRLREVGRIRAGQTQRRAADVGRRAQRPVRDVRGGRVASRGSDRRRGGEHGRRAGGRRGFRPDLDQPADGRAGCPAAAWAPRSGPGRCSRGHPRRSSGCRRSGCRSPPEEVVAGFLPAAIRAHLLSGAAAPEHRTATIAFLQFGGLDQVLAREGARSPRRAGWTSSCGSFRRRASATRSPSSTRTSPRTAQRSG